MKGPASTVQPIHRSRSNFTAFRELVYHLKYVLRNFAIGSNGPMFDFRPHKPLSLRSLEFIVKDATLPLTFRH